MKKMPIVSIMATILFCTAAFDAFAGTKKPYRPSGANYKIYHYYEGVVARAAAPKGSWVQRVNTDTWGSSSCSDPGEVCCDGDWHTWWHGVWMPPTPCKECKQGEIKNDNMVPVGLDPETYEYIFEPNDNPEPDLN